MTVEAWDRTPPYTIAGVGPYAITHPYTTGSIRAVVVLTTGRLALNLSDFSVTPTATTEAQPEGNLFLSPAAAATHAGRQLIIDRVTPDEQGWLAIQGEREQGLMAQLDRMVQSIQEIRAEIAGTVRTRDTFDAFELADGTVPIRDGTRMKSGPTATDIANAQANAAAAAASAAIVADAADILTDAEAATAALNAGLANINARALKSANLSDLGSIAAARTNLGLVIGTHVQAFDPQLTQLAAPGLAGTVKISSGTDYVDLSLIGTRIVYLPVIENPVGVSGVGFDFDWPAPPAGEPAYSASEIVAQFFATAPTATAQLFMQLKVDGVPVTTGYGGNSTLAFVLPSLAANAPGTGHATIYPMEQPGATEPRRWLMNAGASTTTGRIDLNRAWATATAYVVGDIVQQGGISYRCISAHTSGTFATDLAFPRWIVTTRKVTGIRIFQNGTTFNGTGALGVTIRG
jgi:hypothetical protein